MPAKAELSRSRLGRLLGAGAVRLNGEVTTDARATVREGDSVEIDVPPPETSDIVAQDIPLTIVHEDDDLIVIDKPAGMVVHPAPGTPSGTLVNALMHHAGAALSAVGGVGRPGIVHRIDKDTTGLLVVAKTDRAHHALARQFEAHSVHRRYLALCHGAPDAGDPRLKGLRGVRWSKGTLTVTTGLARHKTDRQKQAVVFDGGRHAVTHVSVEQSFGTPAAAALVACRLETGRTHQIRVHMAYAGFGLIGDPVYGGRRRLSARSVSAEAAEAAARFPRQALHAAELGFAHPADGRQLRFTSDLPQDMANLLTLLG